MENIGIVGTGVMGFTVAGKIIDAGHALTVYDISSHAAERAGQLGAQVGKTPGEVAGKSDIVLLFLPGPDDRDLHVGNRGRCLPTSDARHGYSFCIHRAKTGCDGRGVHPRHRIYALLHNLRATACPRRMHVTLRLMSQLGTTAQLSQPCEQ